MGLAGLGICIPAKARRNHPPLDINALTRNMLLRSVRCQGERGFALLKGCWRTLKRVTASPGKTGDITRAALVLTHFDTATSNETAEITSPCLPALSA